MTAVLPQLRMRRRPDTRPQPTPRLQPITPDQLRTMGPAELDELAADIRAVLIGSVTRTGGHLGPNLGVVELTLALHRAFRSPRDAIVFDTGHQSYVHKMLTGRWAEMNNLRQPGGLSGYPSRTESEHDLVENSHASTALSYAAGLAAAFALRGEHDRHAVAVVGDGALTGGMAWEALNNLGAARGHAVTVVLNDNGRSYAPTVGGLAEHLTALRGGARPSVFENLGLGYLGPVDGHDVAAVQAALSDARRAHTPTVVHVVTTKGRGYPPAETDEADRMHTVGPARAASGGPAAGTPSWTSVFADELKAVAAERTDVVALTAAMLRPTGLHLFSVAHPDRVHDVGIAEQHAVTSAAGLAMGGLHPVVAIYATFLNRAFDQVLMDVALHRLPVTFVLDRAGVTGNDGPSHNGMWDLSMLGLVPGLRVAAPRDAVTLRGLLREAVADDSGPTALRYPKGFPGRELAAVATVGSADVLVDCPGAAVLLVGVGAMAVVTLDAATLLGRLGVPATVVDPRWVLPVDPALVDLAGEHALVVTVEDNGVAGGVGDAVARSVRAARLTSRVCSLGLTQRFYPHSSRDAVLTGQGLTAVGVAVSVLEALGTERGAAHAQVTAADRE
ncbi:MAG: 1-deoxy-D-xylulose-5-phosphate synthase [Mycobacteriaceae bacterium]